MNSKEKNFFPNNVQEFGLCKKEENYEENREFFQRH